MDDWFHDQEDEVKRNLCCVLDILNKNCSLDNLHVHVIRGILFIYFFYILA